MIDFGIGHDSTISMRTTCSHNWKRHAGIATKDCVKRQEIERTAIVAFSSTSSDILFALLDKSPLAQDNIWSSGRQTSKGTNADIKTSKEILARLVWMLLEKLVEEEEEEEEVWCSLVTGFGMSISWWEKSVLITIDMVFVDMMNIGSSKYTADFSEGKKKKQRDERSNT